MLRHNAIRRTLIGESIAMASASLLSKYPEHREAAISLSQNPRFQVPGSWFPVLSPPLSLPLSLRILGYGRTTFRRHSDRQRARRGRCGDKCIKSR
mgnify:CR=1 FL=1